MKITDVTPEGPLDPIVRLARIDAYGIDTIPTQQELNAQQAEAKRREREHEVSATMVKAAQHAA